MSRHNSYSVGGSLGETGSKLSTQSRSSGLFIKLNGHASSKKYPSKMRLVVFKDEATGKVYHFITNNFRLAAATIAAIYKQRW